MPGRPARSEVKRGPPFEERWRYLEIVRLLLDRGADPNARDANGETPLDLADGFGEVAALLRSG